MTPAAAWSPMRAGHQGLYYTTLHCTALQYSVLLPVSECPNLVRSHPHRGKRRVPCSSTRQDTLIMAPLKHAKASITTAVAGVQSYFRILCCCLWNTSNTCGVRVIIRPAVEAMHAWLRAAGLR